MSCPLHLLCFIFTCSPLFPKKRNEQLVAELKDSHHVMCKICASPSLRAFLCLNSFAQSLSHVQLFATPWTGAWPASLSMGFPKQEYWSGLPCPPGELPDPSIEPTLPVLQMDSFPAEPLRKPLKSTYFTRSSSTRLRVRRWWSKKSVFGNKV